MKFIGNDRIGRQGLYYLCTSEEAIKQMEKPACIISRVTVSFGLQRCRVMCYLTSRLTVVVSVLIKSEGNVLQPASSLVFYCT